MQLQSDRELLEELGKLARANEIKEPNAHKGNAIREITIPSTVYSKTAAEELAHQTAFPDLNAIRTFETGATRDSDDGKYDYNGFNSSLVEKVFAAYMHKHRLQSDGQLRSSSNWKKGIPKEVYMQSLHRHFMDLWLHLEGFPEEATDSDIESVLCALRFNVNGLLYETLKAHAL